MAGLIVCSKCGQEAEPARERRRVCLSCHRAYKARKANEWYRANPERARATREAGFIRRPETKMVSAAKCRARAKGVEFSITSNDITVPTHCPVLGIKLARGKLGGHAASPSLDRVNNDLGYVKGNVIVVSMKANAIKNSATVLELEQVARYYRSLGAK